MNITKLIVEILQSGKNVEISGIGTFSPQMVDAHHDNEKGVFYPKRRSAIFSNTLSGDNSVIDVLAEKECVNKDIAEKMWQTYISALRDKLTRQGSHSFSGLGTLVRCADGYAFSADPALDLDGGQARPLEGINMYQDNERDDPFASYEQSMQFVAEPEPAPEPEEASAPEPQQPATNVEVKTMADASESEAADPKIETVNEQCVDAPAPNTPEPTPEPAVETSSETIQIRKKMPMEAAAENAEENNSTPQEPEPVAPIPVVEESKPTDNAMPSSEETEKTQMRAEEPQTAANQPAPIMTSTENNNSSNSESARDEVRATIDTLDQIPDSGTPITLPTTNQDEDKKPKKHTWLWILIAILLVLIGVGCYLFFNKSAWESVKSGIASIRGGGSEIARNDDDEFDEENDEQTIAFAEDANSKTSSIPDINSISLQASDEDVVHPEQEEEFIASSDDVEPEPEEDVSEPEETIEPIDAEDNNMASVPEASSDASTQKAKFNVQDYALPFTFSTNLITYDQNDIDRGSRIVRNNLNEYINRFLASRRYTNAKTPMMERIGKYAKGRFGELYDPNTFYVDRLVPQQDYVHDYLYDFLKKRRESQTCVTIQTELMKYSFLDDMLKELVDELGLQPDAAPVKEPAIITVVPKTEVFTAQFVKESKQGYDIVAGFYTNKSTANRMANILKRQGCDAYIIDKQGLYYVSMGSAPTQTAAEALFKHIKSWYDGDIAIRKL